MALESRRALARAFTIVELLVVVGVASFLLSMSIVALRGAKASARVSRSLSVQRQMVVGLSLYHGAHAESFPFLGTPGDPLGPIVVHGHNVRYQGYFFDQSVHWLSVVIPDYIDANAADFDHRDRVDQRGIIRTSYFLTECAFGDPRLFRSGADAQPPKSFFRATRASEVAYPSRKGLTLDVSIGPPAQERGGWCCSFGDGSAGEIAGERWSLDRVVNQPMSTSGAPVLNTLDGLAGRDLE